ncbi:MAG: hypothetical protein WC406_00785 [Methanoregula sp.]
MNRKFNRIPIGLSIIIICILIVTGCTTKPVLDNQTSASTSPITSPTTQPSKALYKVTIAQPNSTHPEFIKMDADVYNQGEVIEFYLKNEGNDSLICMGDFSRYRMYYKEITGSWKYLPGPIEPRPAITVVPTRSEMAPGSSTKVFRLITTGWVPGRYMIQFDCMGISRQFEIRDIKKLKSVQDL